MSFSKMKLPVYECELNGQNFKFHGVGLVDLAAIIIEHRKSLDVLVKEGKEFFSKKDSGASIDDFLYSAIMKSPDLMASIIACSAGFSDEVDYVKGISFPKQIEILEQVFTVTFKEAGGVGKFAEVALSILMKATRAMESITGRMANKNTGTSS
jgi:hypothetical protein